MHLIGGLLTIAMQLKTLTSYMSLKSSMVISPNVFENNMPWFTTIPSSRPYELTARLTSLVGS